MVNPALDHATIAAHPSLDHTTGERSFAWSSCRSDEASLIAKTLRVATGLPWQTCWEDCHDNQVCVRNPLFPDQFLYWKG